MLISHVPDLLEFKIFENIHSQTFHLAHKKINVDSDLYVMCRTVISYYF